MQDLKNRDTWIFDLDNTLYGNESELFDQVGDRMTTFIQENLSLERNEAAKLREKYYRTYGTTLRGLMEENGVKPHGFLKYVHDVKYEVLQKDDALRARLLELKKQGKRLLIYTNSSCEHTDRVLECLELGGIFEDVFDIEKAEWHPKPAAYSVELFFDTMKVQANQSVMFDDLPPNLAAMKQAGVSTVWIDREEIRDVSSVDNDVWKKIDHHTKSLEQFLEKVMA